MGGLEQIDLENAVRAILGDLAADRLVEVHEGTHHGERTFRLRNGEQGSLGAVSEAGSSAQQSSGRVGSSQSQETSDFLDEQEKWLLRILASHAEHTRSDIVTVPDAFERFGIPFPSQWIDGALKKLRVAGFVGHLPELAEQFRGPIVPLKKQGVLAAGQLNQRSGAKDALELLRPRWDRDAVLPEDGRERSRIPESTILLDHNDPLYVAIKDGLKSLYEQIRADNEVGETAGERDRILRSLSAASELWTSTQLQLVQIKVGILMAVEDATQALKAIGKAVGKSILTDLIKHYIRNKTGLDL